MYSSTMPAINLRFDKFPDTTGEMIGSENIRDENKVIFIDDIKEINEAFAVNNVFSKSLLFRTIGVIPTPGITNKLALKLSLSLLFSSILSIWISNAYLLAVFVILSFFNFLICLFLDKFNNFRTKISHLVADFLLIGLSTTFAELILGKIEIPFTTLKISLLSIVLYIMIISYLIIIPKRLLPLTVLTQSKIMFNFIKACKKAIATGKDEFEKLQADEILNNGRKK